MSTPQAILIAVAVLAILFLIHRFAPAKVAQAEHWAAGEVQQMATAVPKIVPTLEADVSSLLAKTELWLTDDSASNAKRAKAAAMAAEADAETATRQAALRAHIATLQAKLPAAPSPKPPAV